MQKPLNFGWLSIGKLMADSFPGQIAGKLVQLERYCQPLFTRHLAVKFDLFGKCVLRIHRNHSSLSLRANLVQYAKFRSTQFRT